MDRRVVTTYVALYNFKVSTFPKKEIHSGTNTSPWYLPNKLEVIDYRIMNENGIDLYSNVNQNVNEKVWNISFYKREPKP